MINNNIILISFHDFIFGCSLSLSLSLSLQQWCYENFVNHRNLSYAVEVRKQLAELCERMNIAMTSCSPQTTPVRRCLLAGLFLSVAEYQREGHYLTVLVILTAYSVERVGILC